MFEIIKNWLSAHSLSTERSGNELRFKHSDRLSSVLIIAEEHLDKCMPVSSPLLAGFYGRCVGAIIGDGYIIIGSPIYGGIEVSYGYRVLGIAELRSQAARLGMEHVEEAEVFMMEASWLFVYGVTPKSERLVRFDREFGTYETISGIESVLNDWWQILVGDGVVMLPAPNSSEGAGLEI